MFAAKLKTIFCLLVVAVTAGTDSFSIAIAQTTEQEPPLKDQPLLVEDQLFDNRQQYYSSDFFKDSGRRCATPGPTQRPQLLLPDELRAAADCTASSTNPSAEYDPVVLYEIPVVVHVIQSSTGQGALSNALIRSQIEVLNEDFQALASTPGAQGNTVGVRFVLADQDPAGNATTGITHTTNNTWFNDQGSYWTQLAWAPARYLNIYTNNAGGNLGYVPFLPMNGAGSSADRVVIHWEAFGRNAPGGPPFDRGRTATHEVGHYLGLEHNFEPAFSCPINSQAPNCYSNGDLICDTRAVRDPNYGCPTGAFSCGSVDGIRNYMNYTDDSCMREFTPEQSRRMRCALEHYRSNLFHEIRASEIFKDDFES